MKQLEPKDSKSNIIKFLAGEDILLSSKDEQILARWEFVNDHLIKKEKDWKEIRELVTLRFHVSKFTAENDIVNAQEVFGITRKINKKYLFHLHLDRIDRDIETIRKAIMFYEDKDGKKIPRVPDGKEIAALAKLHESYTYALNVAPDDVDRKKLPPPIFVFKLPDGQDIPQPMSFDQAMKEAGEYIPHEDLTNGKPTIQPDGSTGEGEDDAGAPHTDQTDPGE
jgi:hypothetical protein